MLQPTPGFIPPPVPLVPTAVNGIVGTGGLLGGMAAGAATGATAGAVLGPKGALVGGLIGGLLVPLLFPLPTAPGTLPGLDPGLNDPEPTPDPQPSPIPDTPRTPIPVPPGMEGQVLLWRVKWVERRTNPEKRWCPGTGGGAQIKPWEPISTGPETEFLLSAERIEIELVQGYIHSYCGGEGIIQNDIVYALLITAIGGPYNGYLYQKEKVNQILNSEYAYNTPGQKIWVDITEITADGEPVPSPFPQPEVPTKPRPTPIPVIPLPAPLPEPAPVPIPEPEPEPLPLEVPSPNNPTAPPITIPKAPPAPPQEVPGPDEEPGKTPITPTPIAPPLPVPGVPTVPEPNPDPNIAPAPGPAPNPLPVPGPDPTPLPGTTPGTDPEPGTFPTPITPGTPGPGPITTPTTPEDPQAVDPETGIVPQPTPLPVPTPPGQHFPVPGGPPVTDGGTRPDLSSIAAEVGRIEQKVARLQNGQDGLDLSDWLWLLPLLQQFFEGDIPGTTYDLQGVCEDVPPGQDQPRAEFPVLPAKNLGAIINRLDALPDIFQQHLAWRTPTCKGESPQGEWRTVHFISDEPNGARGARVLKRFRYRSLGLGTLSDLIDHWSGFTWSAGPVIVKHKDAWWGTPQVWASSGDEGKRVIRHAAAEAGIDPDQVGRWEVGGTSHPRYGLPGTMRVNRKGGYWWITARDGPSERPIVGTAPPDL